MAAGCDAGVVMPTLPSKDVREHLFQALLRYLEIRANVIQLGMPQQQLYGLYVLALLDEA